MKRCIGLFLLLAGTLASAQVRSYSDNASKTFVVGLDSYFYGASGSLDFVLGGHEMHATLSDGTVSVNGTVLSQGPADTVIGIHDFTEDREPELVVARRLPEGVSAMVYARQEGSWTVIGKASAPDGREIRIFRQVLSVRSGEVLRSWTWHGRQFDYKASDGSPEPNLP